MAHGEKKEEENEGRVILLGSVIAACRGQAGVREGKTSFVWWQSFRSGSIEPKKKRGEGKKKTRNCLVPSGGSEKRNKGGE